MARYVLIFVLALYAAPAMAASTVATPALSPPAGGAIICTVSNASDKKPILVELAIYGSGGILAFGPVNVTLPPLQNTSASGGSGQLTCVVKVLKGAKKNVRLALYAQDSSGNIVAAVTGN